MSESIEPADGWADCDRCYRPITGDAIHDDGDVWHVHCRRELIAERAAATADRLIAADVGLARTVCRLQRVEPIGATS